MNLNISIVLFLTVIFTPSTTLSNSKLTGSPQVRIGIIDFSQKYYDSLNSGYTINIIPEYTLNFYLRPISTNSYSFTRETSLLKNRLLNKYFRNYGTSSSYTDSNLFLKLSLKDSKRFLQSLSVKDLHYTNNNGTGRFRENMKYNLYSYSHSLDSFQLNNPREKSIENLMKELSEYRNNNGLYTIENCDLKHFYYDTINSQYRTNLMSYTGSVVGLSMLRSASQDLNSQIHYQMKRNNGKYSWKDIHWGKVISSGVAGGLTSAYVIKAENRGNLAGTNSFGGRVVRKLVTNTIEMGVQSIGLLYDSRQHEFDYTEAQKLALLNQTLKMGSSGMNAIVNRYIFRSTWDPWFEHFRKQIHGFDPHKDIHKKFDRDIQLKKPFDSLQSNFTVSDFPDTISVIPLIDFGWPILGREEKKQKEFFIPLKKENKFLE